MPSPNSTFTEMVSTTMRNHPSTIADNVSAHNALYRYLKRKGKVKLVDGGYEIVRPIDYAENSTFQRYSGYDTLNIQASDVLSAAKFPWVQAAVHVTASGNELRNNSGRSQIIDLAEARVNNAVRTAANNMSLDLYGTGALANQMTGLGGLISTAGTGTVGGIDSGTFTFWANKFRESVAVPAAATIKGEMNALYLTLVRGTDSPDLIVSTHDFFSFFWASLQDIQRYVGNDVGVATAGFRALKYVDADVIFDSNANFATNAEKMYFLNTDYIELVSHRQANWTQLDDKNAINQDAVVIPIVWQGQLVISNRSLQGVLIDAS